MREATQVGTGCGCVASLNWANACATIAPCPPIAVRLLREEVQLLQEPGSYVGEVVKQMGKKKVLVKV